MFLLYKVFIKAFFKSTIQCKLLYFFYFFPPHDIAEILLKLVLNTNQSINPCICQWYDLLMRSHMVFVVHLTCIKYPKQLKLNIRFIFFLYIFYTHFFLYMENIHTLSENIKFICTSCRNWKKSEPLASFSGLFYNECK
jgi:hypothetical protein